MNLRPRLFRLALRMDQRLAASPVLRRSSGKAKMVFFPGCSLAGYSPAHVFAVRDFIRERWGECGVLMACCAKPLKLMGAGAPFQRRRDGVLRELDAMGAEAVIAACQNCFKVLQGHGRQVLSLWPLMAKAGLPDGCEGKYRGLEASVQDSCITKDVPEIAASVRKILRRLGVTVREMERRGRCCGGIPMVTTGDVGLGRAWMRERAAESPCPAIVSYCASCRSAMGIDGGHKSLHLLDLIFNDGQPSPPGSSLLNRWRTARRVPKL